jgi:hypothetical protein
MHLAKFVCGLDRLTVVVVVEFAGYALILTNILELPKLTIF